MALVFAGGVLAVVSMLLCGLLARQIWLTHEVPQNEGIWGVSALYVLFVAGVYVFALGFELYDMGKALRLTFIIAVMGVLALAVMVSVFAALAWVKSGAGAIGSEKHGNLVGAIAGFDVMADEEPEPKRHPLDFRLECKNCRRDFIPVPPDAVCPWCDTAYLTA